MPPDLQVKFLRVLEEKRVTPVGGNESKDVDFRLVAATNRDLSKEIEVGRFRQDLYYRLTVVTIEIPPLRERKDDIPLLVERFRDVFAREHDRAVTGVTPAALSALVSYAWPGNVRELKNVLESAVLFAAGPKIDVSDLPPALRPGEPAGAEGGPDEAGEGLASMTLLVGKTMAEIEKNAILTALQISGGNRRRAAQMLDIGLRTLQRKLKEYRGEAEGDEDEEIGEDTAT
jgi:DNA-binding NtrC family response regulator